MATNENDVFSAVTGSLGKLLGAGSIGAIAIIVVALIKPQPRLALLIEARIKMLIESYEKQIGGYEKRVAILQEEIDDFEAKVDVLTKQLYDAREQRGLEM